MMNDLSNTILSSKIYDWSDKGQINQFYTYMCDIFSQDFSLLRVIQLFSLMMSAHKAEVTWLDEIAEALKNCALALDSYLLKT
mgnify:CR=1 FL=1